MIHVPPGYYTSDVMHRTHDPETRTQDDDGFRPLSAAGVLVAAVIVLGPLALIAQTPTPAPAGSAPDAVAPVTAEQRASLMRDGELVFGRNCAECHGDGGVGGPFRGKPALADKDRVITRILAGATDGSMEPFGPLLSDHDIAAVATFIRNSFDNSFGVVADADVKRVRAALPRK